MFQQLFPSMHQPFFGTTVIIGTDHCRPETPHKGGISGCRG